MKRINSFVCPMIAEEMHSPTSIFSHISIYHLWPSHLCCCHSPAHFPQEDDSSGRNRVTEAAGQERKADPVHLDLTFHSLAAFLHLSLSHKINR